ncbi:hypothetical protein ACIP9X_20340 [Arthrobacter sp. NPDC093125]|uniref:hypothetical protein n=1 Tax=Arthrobacter sp. NPDC093125 TaxID=3363944 RepID=UPI003811C5F8
MTSDLLLQLNTAPNDEERDVSFIIKHLSHRLLFLGNQSPQPAAAERWGKHRLDLARTRVGLLGEGGRSWALGKSEYTSMAEAMEDYPAGEYPAGGYRHCESESGCRGTLMFLREEK